MFVRSTSKQTGADRSAVRRHNLRLVLYEIWRSEALSRADIARRTGLARSTISDITGELLERGWVHESHVVKSKGGRPPIALEFDRRRGFIVGVEMGASHLTVVLCDLRASVFAERQVDCDVQTQPAETLALLHATIDQLVQANGRDMRCCLGIGLGVPGPVDRAEPNLLSQRILPMWKGVNPVDSLTERYDVMVLIDNDANVGALAELWWGQHGDVTDLTYIKVATGVGAGHIIGGSLHYGASGIAGEIGHTAIDPHGPRCRCGLQGCLEALVGSRSIENAVQRDRGDTSRPSLESIVRDARDDDPVCIEVVEQAGRYLGVAIANLFNLLNPAVVVLGGRLTQAGDLLTTPMHSAVASRTLGPSLASGQVQISTLGDHAIARGAATLVLQKALQETDMFHLSA